MSTAAQLYLDLMKKCLTNIVYDDAVLVPVAPKGVFKRGIVSAFQAAGLLLARRNTSTREGRAAGLENFARAHTLIGLRRLDNIQACVEDVLRNGIPGDLIETGVWRGGATAFMRAILKAHGVQDRTVWVADSFDGLPPPNEKDYPADAGDTHHTKRWLAIGVEQVKETFRRYDLLDDQVKFLEGWFKDTLPTAPIERLAVMRLDGDMYESTMDALASLYPRLSVGGYVIIDDWEILPMCRKAVDDYRERHGITEPIRPVDGNAGFWQRER